MGALRASRRAAAACLAATLLAAGASARAAEAPTEPGGPAAPAGPAAAAARPAAAEPRLAEDQPIELDASSSELDYRSNTLVFRTVRIAQGRLSVEADTATATGLDFKDSRWVFSGHVRISVPDGFLTSDEARIAFADNAIATALITGAPAAFEQRREQRVARGHAARIEYDFGAGTVRLTDDAWLSDGDTEITGRTLVYSLRDQRVLASASEQNSQRVRITIKPRKTAAAPDGQQKP
jgi:lipopolysaccharide transport protein LptA